MCIYMEREIDFKKLAHDCRAGKSEIYGGRLKIHIKSYCSLKTELLFLWETLGFALKAFN